MPDNDFVLNVKQILNYPNRQPVLDTDFVLLQDGSVGNGAYFSANVAVLVATALQNTPGSGGFLQLAPGNGIAWNGASLTWMGGLFSFSENVTAPNFLIGNLPVATQQYVLDQNSIVIEAFNDLTANTVNSFNGRTGVVMLVTDDILRAGGAPVWNPHLGGFATAPTPWDPRTNNDQIATTAFVHNAICFQLGNMTTVSSFNGRFGDITLTTEDINAAYANSDPGVFPTAPNPAMGDASSRIATTLFVDDSLADLQNWVTSTYGTGTFAPLNSPNFTGIPTGPTANPGTSTGQLATTSYVQHAITAATAGVSSFNTRTGAVVLTSADVTGAGGALLASPVFTGVPAAPTAAPGNSSTQLATTAFVAAAIAGIGTTAGVSSFNTRTGAVVLTTGDITAAGGAPTASPTFSGVPNAPTPAQTSNDGTLATTAYVRTAIAALPTAVTSFNSRTGAVTLLAADISAAGGALVASPTFTGVPAAPTATAGTNTTQLATTAFVQAAVGGIAAVTSFNTRSGAVTLTAADVTGVGGAMLASPAFTGVPTAPTPPPTSNDTTVATTAYVKAAIAGISTGVTSFNTRTGAVTLIGADVSAAGGALIASPTFTGVPAAPTATAGTNTTQLATCAFVMNQIATAGGVTTFNGRAGAVTLTLADVTLVGGASAAQIFPQSGRLTMVSATALQYLPTRGNLIKIQGQLLVIPNAGIAGMTNISVCFVNGVASQSLAPNTTYWVYAFVNLGVVTADFVTSSSHGPSTTAGNEGVEIQTGSESRTLIGMIRTTPSGQIVNGTNQRLVISWFNRRLLCSTGTTTAGAQSASTAGPAEISGPSRAEFLTWGENDVPLGLMGWTYNSNAGAINQPTILFDTSGYITYGNWAYEVGANQHLPAGGSYGANFSEGYHWVTPAMVVSAGTATCYLTATATIYG